MAYKEHIENILNLVPNGKSITQDTLAKIFFTSPETLNRLLPKWWNDDHKSNVLRDPSISNYYVSLMTSNQEAVEEFEKASYKLQLLHPETIFKTPHEYHITLADMNWCKIHRGLIDNVMEQWEGLSSFSFHCSFSKPFIDTKKEKIVFWIRIKNDPFLLTLHHCLKSIIPRRTDKKFIPHITLWKILKRDHFDNRVNDILLETTCIFDQLCITANIDNHKNIVIFSKKLG